MYVIRVRYAGTTTPTGEERVKGGFRGLRYRGPAGTSMASFDSLQSSREHAYMPEINETVRANAVQVESLDPLCVPIAR